MRGQALNRRGVLAILTASALMLSLMPAGALAYAVQSSSDTGTNASAKHASLDTDRDMNGDQDAYKWGDYFDSVDEAEAILKNAVWRSEPGKVTNKDGFWNWIEVELAALGLSKVHVRFDETSLTYTDPIAGTPENPYGTDGVFSIKLHIYRSWLDVLVARPVMISGVLEAQPYVPQQSVEPEPEDPTPDPIPNDPSGSDVPDVPDVPNGPDPEQPSNGGEDPKGQDHPNTPPTDSDQPSTGEESDAAVENAKVEISKALAQTFKGNSDSDTGELSLPNDMFKGVEFDTIAAAEKSVKEHVFETVKAALEELALEGVAYELDEPEVKLPTLDEEGSFSCDIYLTPTATDKNEGDPEEHEVFTLEASGFSLHPLNAVTQATNVSASLGSDSSASADPSIMLPDRVPSSNRVPDYVVRGTIPRQAVNVKSAAPTISTGTGMGIGNKGSHPLMQNGITPSGDDSNQKDNNNGDNREVKRPQRSSEDKRNTPSVTTTVEKGAPIASTRDPLSGSMSLLASVGSIAAVVAVVSLLLIRRKRED